MKLDFTKSDGIIEVTQTCPYCRGRGRSPDHCGGWILCDRCDGAGKVIDYLTPRSVRVMLDDLEGGAS